MLSPDLKVDLDSIMVIFMFCYDCLAPIIINSKRGWIKLKNVYNIELILL